MMDLSQLERLIAEHAPEPDELAAEPVVEPQAPGGDAPSRKSKRKPRSSTRSLVEWLLVIGAALCLYLPNWLLTHLTGLSRDGRVAVATAGFFVLFFVFAWALRQLQARRLI
jgi:hypothetical protein